MEDPNASHSPDLLIVTTSMLLWDTLEILLEIAKRRDMVDVPEKMDHVELWQIVEPE